MWRNTLYRIRLGTGGRIMENGLIELLGGKSHWWTWIISILVFLIGLITMILISAYSFAGKYKSTNGIKYNVVVVSTETTNKVKIHGFLYFFLFGGLWYLLCWGFTNTISWIILIPYLILGSLASVWLRIQDLYDSYFKG
jgi:hypothetical protein